MQIFIEGQLGVIKVISKDEISGILKPDNIDVKTGSAYQKL